jgi:hypothetical protein
LTLGACLLSWVLLGPLDFIGRAYLAGVQRAADAAMRPFGGAYATRVLPPRYAEEPRAGLLLIVLRERSGAVLWVKPFNARRATWVPTAIFLALALLTALPWRRKLAALAGGLALVQGYAALCVAARVLYSWIIVEEQRHLELAAFLEHPWTKSALNLWLRAENEAFPQVLVPIVVWALVCFRAADWERWFGRAPERAEPADGPT